MAIDKFWRETRERLERIEGTQARIEGKLDQLLEQQASNGLDPAWRDQMLADFDQQLAKQYPEYFARSMEQGGPLGNEAVTQLGSEQESKQGDNQEGEQGAPPLDTGTTTPPQTFTPTGGGESGADMDTSRTRGKK